MRSDCVYEHVRFTKGWDFEMNLKDQMNGIQHVGVPTNDIETTIKFYEALGFEIAFQTVNEAANEKVALKSCDRDVREQSCKNGIRCHRPCCH